MDNIVKYNLRNCHWGTVEFDETDVPQMGPPNPWPGAVSLALDPQGNITKFYADGILYWRAAANDGYEGDFETALVPELFREMILMEKKDQNGVFIEVADVETKHFYLMYEVEGDQKARRCILYNCTVTRPGAGGKTNEDSKEVETDKVTLTASPLPGGLQIKAMTSADTDQDVYDDWYEEPYYNPTVIVPAELTSLSLGATALVPEFDPKINTYTAVTDTATNTITATAAEGAAIRIMVNGLDLENGNPATWQDGDNTVTILVENAGDMKAYTVLVTKE